MSYTSLVGISKISKTIIKFIKNICNGTLGYVNGINWVRIYWSKFVSNTMVSLPYTDNDNIPFSPYHSRNDNCNSTPSPTKNYSKKSADLTRTFLFIVKKKIYIYIYIYILQVISFIILNKFMLHFTFLCFNNLNTLF